MSTLVYKPWEDFKEGWSNDDFKSAFIAVLIDLFAAQYQTSTQLPKFVEDFDEHWQENENYVYIFVPGGGAVYSPGDKDAEDFEAEWDSNENFLYVFVGVGVDLIAATFNATNDTAEGFEAEWDSNENFLFAFVGSGTDLSEAVYQGAVGYEAFDPSDGWPEL